MLICSNCKKTFDEQFQLITLRSFRITSYDDIFYFCSGICHTIWMLEDCHDMALIYSTVESTWYPIIRQLRDQLKNKLNELDSQIEGE